MHSQAEVNGVKVRKTITVRREILDAVRRQILIFCLYLHACLLVQSLMQIAWSTSTFFA